MERLAKIFIRFSEVEAQKSIPLYAYWSKKISEDRELLTLIQFIPDSQPKPNMFFASVQYLALKQNHPLKTYYSIFDQSENYLEESFKCLKEFVRLNEEALINCFLTKLVQTNELNRSSYLYPIMSEIAYKTGKPLTLIEIGTSAGLLLNLDNYQYEIKETNQVLQFGNFKSDVVVHAENNGEPLTAIRPFQVSERVGVDLNIVDLNEEEDYEWMQALIWPEQKSRKELLRKVRTLNKNIPKKLYAGDFLQVIPSFLQNIDNGTQTVIFHTHVANQFDESLKIKLLTMIHNISEQHPIYHVYNNMYDRHLHIDYITQSSTEKIKIINEVDGHGKYFSWIQ
ncbi:DUF2332 domain-containing protein [Ureibacillus sinduriensis]|nr:DUF2332 domain-containing protein [Ureibacillus sinduriensis]